MNATDRVAVAVPTFAALAMEAMVNEEARRLESILDEICRAEEGVEASSSIRADARYRALRTGIDRLRKEISEAAAAMRMK